MSDAYRAQPGEDSVLILPPQSKTMVALDRGTGHERWRVALPFAAHAWVLAGDCILLSSSGGEVCAVSLTGELVWHNELSGLRPGPAAARRARRVDVRTALASPRRRSVAASACSGCERARGRACRSSLARARAGIATLSRLETMSTSS